jgi:hypothetical protein
MSVTKVSHKEADRLLQNEEWCRVMGRIERVDQGSLYFRIIQIDPEDEAFFQVPILDFPAVLREKGKVGEYFLAQARFDRGDPPTLVQLKDFELAPEPDPDDELG